MKSPDGAFLCPGATRAPLGRHEVEPTVPFAVVSAADRETFLFYHLDAAGADINGLWEYARFCLSNLVWVNDHFVVTPNPCYLNPAPDLEGRVAKVKRVLLNWYGAKRLVGTLGLGAD
ncbi:MAG: hypothetical protein AVDCRST_MAG77-3219 [uncultured Chloroflexi bacterium]|uniref:Uncharacterized protein n=1 Tax=uncultured Chloroflexota bacterium TaxID=166587 RepID=A0A6J4J6E8_9CHLR|nr:MAG: hypothetical protein AVDCRST_MAG77-3219 [uncultured Chloroflexota bacterium]